MPNELMITNLETMFENIRQTDDGKYSVYDYLQICTKYKNLSELFKRICDKHPEIINDCEYYIFPRSNGRKNNQGTPVTTIENLFKIGKHLKSNKLKPHLESDVYVPRTEDQINKVLLEVYKDENPQIQYKVGKYKIDLYLLKSKVAIECDEYSHKNYKNHKETERETYIKKHLNCNFIRFDPYIKGFNIGTVIYEINKYVYATNW